MLKLLWFLTFILFFCHLTKAFICKSVNIRNGAESLKELEGCTVVEGSVKIVLMERSNETDFAPYSFPALREITQFLMFYRIKGLRSIGKLFPNLEKIGGDVLFLDFALVIDEMWSLQEIGLKSLREISRGSVIIFKNSNLCYVDTINWDWITKWDAVKNYMALNHDPKDCPRCLQDCPGGFCWSSKDCQMKEAERHNCNRLCVGGCSAPGPKGCYSCRGVLDPNGNCVDQCPPNTFVYLNRRCITWKECVSTKWEVHDTPIEGSADDSSDSSENGHFVIFENKCLESCPSGYEPDLRGSVCLPCSGGQCENWCLGAEIRSTEDAQALRGCTHINGSIELTIKSENSQTVYDELRENLGSIQEIAGYLKIIRSSVTDLNFFTNLTVIHGNDTAGDYALYVLENKNLQELWNWDDKKNFTILNGRVFFHYNPKLCLQHIYELLNVIHYETNVSNFEIGKESNGDKFPCTTTNIEITVTSKTSNTIEIHVPFVHSIYMTPVLRYVLYYTKDPFRNITVFDDIDQCSDYGWRTKDFSEDSNNVFFKAHGFHANLTDLEPDTQYVFYVTTYTFRSIGAKSDMNYETTLPGTPTELTRLEAFSNSSSEIVLKWDPPNHINGKLEEYVVTWSSLQEENHDMEQRDYCEFPMKYVSESKNQKPAQTVKVTNSTCCKNPNSFQKEEFESLCSNFKTIHFPTWFPDKTKFSSCESYFYNYIHNSPFHINTNVFDFNNKNLFPVSNNNYVIYSEDGVNKLLKSSSKKQLLVKNKIQMERNVSHIQKDLRGTVIRFLKNYQDYVVTVKACRKVHPEEVNLSDTLRCSKAEIITVRTLKNKTADRITNKISYRVKDGVLSIRWNPPENPNGRILAFEIEHQLRYEDNSYRTTECITSREFEIGGRQYSLARLPAGNYEFRIRLVSLSGKGPFTPFMPFDVVDSAFSPMVVFLIIVMEVVIVVVISFSSFVFKNQKLKSSNIVIADVNPNYGYVTDQYEVPRENVEFVKELGVGSFGKVYEGLLKPDNLRCAIKTVMDGATQEHEHEFLSEVTVMKSMTEAYHIVKLLGVVSQGRPPLVIMELMELGDLKSYLRLERENHTLSNGTMIKMASEIADAMTFMEANKFVHRDLAARNCMVGSDLTIKVGDFGMARDIYETDYYRKCSKGLMPIRWMAPESLRDGEYTSQSDIWSYGVVLWEIVTMAEQPYQGFSNKQVLREVIAGRRLEIPKHCPISLRAVMRRCWKSKPSNRSSFFHIISSLKYYHDEEFRTVSFYYSKDAAYLRPNTWEYVEMETVEDPLLGGKEYRNMQIPRTYSVLPCNGLYRSKTNKLAILKEEDGS